MAKKKPTRKREGGAGKDPPVDPKPAPENASEAEPVGAPATSGDPSADAGASPAPSEAPPAASPTIREEDAAPAGASAPPVAAKATAGPLVVKVGDPVPRRTAPWGEPFAKIARAFDWFEIRLLFGALLGLVFLLASWVALVGMSAPLESDSSEGGVFRGIVGAVVLGGLSRPLTKKLGWSEGKRAGATAVAVVIAILVAPLWRSVGVEYFGHLKTWLQEGSALTMLGGLRGVGTRVTILLALVGGSLAAASGKHINIDVVMRFMPDRLKVPVFALSTLATSAVLLAASWGFFDYIAIESFNYRPTQLQVHEAGAPPVAESTKREEIAFVQKKVGQHLFLFRKQIGLDLSAVPHVLGGGKWDDPARMNGRAWNELVETGGFRERFSKEEVDGLRAPDEDLDGSRIPLVVVPGGGSARNLLIPAMNLMFPFGFIIIALRFLLRLVLVISGHESLEDDAEASLEATDGRATGISGPEAAGKETA
jgi:TRAP-type C4-dicarboxylate transport system permease small subunit